MHYFFAQVHHIEPHLTVSFSCLIKRHLILIRTQCIPSQLGDRNCTENGLWVFVQSLIELKFNKIFSFYNPVIIFYER